MDSEQTRCKVCGARETPDNPLLEIMGRWGKPDWLCLDAEACESRAVNWT